MLFVMSLRTTPSSVRMFGPLVPSPGYGPSVSSGICSQVASAAPAAVVVVDEDPPVDALVEPLAPELPLPSPPQAVSTTAAPMPPNQVRSSRRLGVGVCTSLMPTSVPALRQVGVAGR